MFFRFLVITYGCLYTTQAQVITNGDFSAGETGWTDCLHETEHTDIAYGGSSSTNIVGEVDSEVSLCQTISGFTIGNTYRLSFKSSRRSSDCSPNPANINFSIDGGALNQNLSKTNPTFNLTTSSFEFKATRATHQLNITALFSEQSTCGVLFDDLSIQLLLPITFWGFDLSQCDRDICIQWTASSSTPNAKYEVQRSHDAITWEVISHVVVPLDINIAQSYEVKDVSVGSGVNYYRVVASDQYNSYSTGIKSVRNSDVSEVYPNPTQRYVYVRHIGPIKVVDYLGMPILDLVAVYEEDQSVIDFGQLKPGVYFVIVDQTYHKVVKSGL